MSDGHNPSRREQIEIARGVAPFRGMLLWLTDVYCAEADQFTRHFKEEHRDHFLNQVIRYQKLFIETFYDDHFGKIFHAVGGKGRDPVNGPDDIGIFRLAMLICKDEKSFRGGSFAEREKRYLYGCNENNLAAISVLDAVLKTAEAVVNHIDSAWYHSFKRPGPGRDFVLTGMCSPLKQVSKDLAA